MTDKKQTISSLSGVIVVILIIGIFVYFNGNGGSEKQAIEGELDVFAKCVTDKGLSMYGAAWCGHCASEKKAFGDSFKFINYVECPDNITLCTYKEINGYPTWMDADGKKYEGAQGLNRLAQISGCEL